MDLGSFLILLSFFALVAMFVLKPIVDHRSTSVTKLDQKRSALLAERDHLLDILQELDFDFKLGKIQEEDYRLQRTEMLQNGKDLLQQIDDLESRITANRPKVSDAVEKAIAARRAAAAAGPRQPVSADDDLERMIAARKRERTEKSAGFCPQCGQPAQQSDKFCSKCGTSLA